MRIIICDDELTYINKLMDIIEKWCSEKGVLIPPIASYTSSEDALDSNALASSYDLAFLDIQFPGEISGIELARTLRRTNENMCIVFTTNYKDYALEGYKVNALRYMLKPVEESQVFECLDIAYRQWKLYQNESIVLNGTDHTHHIQFKSIVYVESKAHYMYVNLDNNNVIRIRGKLSDLLPKLPSDEFVMCHRSFIVNLLYVQSISKTTVLLSDGRELPVSRNCWETALRKFRYLFQGGLYGN